jgi:hypothetical protein
MDTDSLISLKNKLEKSNIFSELMSSHLADAESIETKSLYTLIRITFPVPLNVLVTKKSNSEKVDVIEYTFPGMKNQVDLVKLKNDWGNYKILDNKDRDNIFIVLYEFAKHELLRRIELVSRELPNEDLNTLDIESVKFCYS